MRLSSSEKIGLIGNLSTLLSSGIPILDSVNSLLEDSKGSSKKILETLKEDLIQGKHVYASFSRFPQVFDKVTINLIKASEEAGNLDTVLADLSGYIQKEVEFTDKIKFALIYPIFVLIVFAGVLLTILLFVIPRIATVFSRLKVTLPLPTKILIFVSDLLIHQTLYAIGGVVLFTLIIFLIFRYRRNLVLEILYSFPLISQLVKDIDFTRFSRSLHLLLRSGLPIVSALELTREVVIRKQTTHLIDLTRQTVLSGKRLSEGLRLNRGYIPQIMIKLVEAGEKSGTLEKSMGQISTYLDYQVSNTLKTATAVMEPLLLLLVGLTVGVMMIAIIAPIYGLVGQIGSR